MSIGLLGDVFCLSLSIRDSGSSAVCSTLDAPRTRPSSVACRTAGPTFHTNGFSFSSDIFHTVPFCFFFLSSRFLRRRRVASIVAALPEGACGSMGAMPRTIPRIFWPAPESRPSDKCSGRRCSLAELWFPFDFFFLKKYLFIYPSREERQQLQVAYHRPRSTFFFPLSYPPISGSDCGSVTSPLYYFLFSFLLVVVFVHINQLHRHITMDANRGRVE